MEVKKHFSRLFFLVSLCFYCLVWHSAPGFALDSSQKYFQLQRLQPQLLPPPPVEGSKAWKKQINEVLREQHGLSVTEIAAIRNEQRAGIESMISVIGPGFKKELYPKTFAMIDLVANGTSKIIDMDKQFWHTRRPYLTDSRVKLYVDPVNDSPSYPSGHSAFFRVMAEILGLLFPEKLDPLRERAQTIAHHRIEAGAHYPVDIQGGQNLAMLILGALTASDAFQSDLEASRNEIAGVAGTLQHKP